MKKATITLNDRELDMLRFALEYTYNRMNALDIEVDRCGRTTKEYTDLHNKVMDSFYEAMKDEIQ